MAIAIDASTPAMASGDSSPDPVTTASFNPPASLLVACIGGDGTDPATFTITNNGDALTWTSRVKRTPVEAGAENGNVEIFTTVLTSSRTGMTVSISSNLAEDEVGLKVYVVTGADTSSPVGAVGEGSSTTNNISPTVYTSTANNSRAFGVANDWNQNGVPTTTDSNGGTYNLAGFISGIAVSKASDTSPSGTNVTLNFDAAGIGAAAWNWCAVEIKPAGGGTERLPSGLYAPRRQPIHRASIF